MNDIIEKYLKLVELYNKAIDDELLADTYSDELSNIWYNQMSDDDHNHVHEIIAQKIKEEVEKASTTIDI